MQDIAEPWIPQMQLMFAHRFAVAKAQQESINAYRLDAFGQGVPETKIGVDVFQGMTDFKLGAAYSFLLPGERNLGGVDYDPGMGQRGVFTAGYGRSGIGKALVGLTRETRAEKRLNGVEVGGSRTVDNGVFIMADSEVTDSHMARLTWARRSAVFKNRNGSRSDTFTLAWMWTVAP